MYKLWSRHPLNKGKEPKIYEFKDLDDLANEICSVCTMTQLSPEEHFAAVQYIEQVPELLTKGRFRPHYESEDDELMGCLTWTWERKGTV